MIAVASARPRRQQGGKQTAIPVARSAPVGGWNSRDPKDNMPVTDALRLNNWFPRQRDIVSRPGYSPLCDLATNAPVRRLMPFEYGTSLKLLAASNGKIFEASTSTPALLAEDLTSDYYSWCQLGGRLFMANGVDDLLVYNGTTVAASTFTGVGLDNADISFVHVHKRRIYAVEKNTQSFWYGDPSAITGTLTEFDMSTVNKFSGNLMLLTTISITGGTNPQDLLIAIFESGDLIAYSGSDPGDATDWSEVGVFKIGRPLSRFGIISTGNDVMVLTDKGYESLRISIPNGIAQGRDKLVSEKIQQSVTAAIKAVGASDQWSIDIWPTGQMDIVQLPSAAPEEQHVRNFNTGAWCEFSGLNASAWARFGAKFVYGTRDGKVREFGAQDTDNGLPIRCDVITAWDAFGNRATIKQHTLQRLEIEALRLSQVRLAIGTDFQEPSIGARVDLTQPSEVATWDTEEWDTVSWSSASTSYSPWVKCPGIGRYSCMRLTVDVNEFATAWAAVTYLSIPGGIV